MTTLNASNLTLDEVHQLLKLEETPSLSFESLLTLEPLTDSEQQDLQQIASDFRPYLASGKMSEGVVKAMTTFPLLRLAGFYRPPIRLRVEEGIASIDRVAENTKITGRFDILSVNYEQLTANNTSFWILVVEAKEGLADPWAGLPQLLTYAYKSLENQASVWGLATNGLVYRFAYIEAGTPPTYQLMPVLEMLDFRSFARVLQVLKAICKLVIGH